MNVNLMMIFSIIVPKIKTYYEYLHDRQLKNNTYDECRNEGKPRTDIDQRKIKRSYIKCR